MDGLGSGVLDAHPDPMWIYDLRTNGLTGANRAALDLYGYVAEEVEALKVGDLFSPAVNARRIADALAQVAASGAHDGLWQHVTCDHRLIDVSVRIRRIERGARALMVAREVGEAERSLLRKHEELQGFLAMAAKAARLGAWRYAAGSPRVEWSDATAEIHGEPHGTSPTFARAIDYFAPEYRERLRSRFAACLERGEPYDEVLELITARGRRIFVRASGMPERDATGAVVAVRGAVQDITELIEARRRSAALADRLRKTLESISDGLFTVDADWNFTFVNRRAETIMQRQAADLIGTNMWTVFPGAAATEFGRRHLAARNTGTTQSFVEFYAPLGRWLKVSSYPAEGGLAVYFQDVTEERARSNQLRLLENAIAKLNDIVIISAVRPDGGREIAYVNEAFSRILGYSREEMVGQPGAGLWAPSSRPEVNARIRQSLVAGRRVTAENVVLSKSGSEIWLELDFNPLRDPSGGITHWICVARDITERRALEAQVRSAQKMEAIGQLTGGIAHDFNNLLTVILGSAEALQDSVTGVAEPRELVDLTIEAAVRGKELTDRLLAFGRRQTLEPEPVDLGRMLEDMEGLLRRALGRSVEIALEPAPPGAAVAFADRGQLETAVLNLALNARDALPSGGRITFAVDAAPAPSEGGRAAGAATGGNFVAITVTDEGEGMAPEVVERAFEPFFTTKPTGKGSGLGLSMVYGFVRQSGGEVKLASAPGRGTTVTLLLPRSTAQAVQVRARPGQPMVERGHETVLVVEDDDLVRAQVTNSLQRLGYVVVVARTGPEALARLDSGPTVDLVFTDVVMPGGMNGWELAAEARRRHPRVKVVVTSGFPGGDPRRDEACDEKVIYIAKPYRHVEIADTLRRALGTGSWST